MRGPRSSPQSGVLRQISVGGKFSGPANNCCGGLESGEQISLSLRAVHTSGMCWDGPS